MLVDYCRRVGIAYTRRAIGPLCDNVTSSTKPEVHNVSEDDRSDIYKTFGERSFVVFEYASGQTDRQTYSSQYLAPL